MKSFKNLFFASLFTLCNLSIARADLNPDFIPGGAAWNNVATIQQHYNFKIARPDCVRDSNDPFDPANIDYRGLCTDNHEERIPVLMNEDDETITVANFRHGRTWWVASIPKKGISEVFFQTATFNSAPGTYLNIAHVQIRFVMNKNTPIVLHSQILGQSQTVSLTDFVASPEPFMIQDEAKESAWSSFFEEEGFVTRLVSEDERGTDEIGFVWNNPVDQTELKLEPEQRAHLLEVVIARSNRHGYLFPYSGTSNNCSVEAVGILSEAFPPADGHLLDVEYDVEHIYNPFNGIIGQNHHALQQLGLIDKDSAQFTLEDEYSSGIPFFRSMIPVDSNNDEKNNLIQRIHEDPPVFSF